MSDIFDTAAQVARDAVPKVLCGAGGLSRLGQDIAGKVNPFYEGSLLDGYQTGVTRALQGFCPVPPTGPVPTPTPPFEGGQCPGVQYRITGTATQKTRDSCFESAVPISSVQTGPITDIKLAGPVTDFSCSPGETGYLRVEVTRAGGTTTIATPGSNRRFINVSGLTVVRVDGLPDTCGSPPPVFPPGTPTPNPPNPPGTDVTINLPGIGPVVVAFTPIVGVAFVDANAEFNVPVTVNVDLGGQNINFDLDFDVNISNPTAPVKPAPPDRPKNPDDRVEPPDCPPPADCRNEPGEDPPEEEPEDEDPKEFIVTGAVALCVVNAATTKATEVVQANGPNIWVPRLGYIRFKYLTNRGDIVWGTDIALKGVNFATEAPDLGIKCIGAVLNTERGVSGELILLRKKRTAGCC